jgi:hypothetical protein
MTTQQRQLILSGIPKDKTKCVKQPQTTLYHLGEGVPIGPDWKITSDRYNIILWRKEGKSKPRWRSEGFYSTIGNALIGLVRQSVRDTELESIQAVQDRIVQLELDIMKMAAGR